MKINNNFTLLPENYLFSEVAARMRQYKELYPEAKIIRMDIGDVTLPIPHAAVNAMHKALDDMTRGETFHGYGPEQGYLFLRNAIAVHDYKQHGMEIGPDEIFISDGAKSDLGNLGDIYSDDARIGVCDPGYPVYSDCAVLSGRAGNLDKNGRWSNLIYIECSPENNFEPRVPEQHCDVIILCSPNNPTGTVMTRETLTQWVEYALRENALIIFDSAYEAFITDPTLPKSIYEIEGARKVAIEIRSYSKTAGFTGLRCGYTVVPTELTGMDAEGNAVELRKLWLRRQTTKFNGASYIVQRGAEALYTPEGLEEVSRHIAYYLRNADLIANTMREKGFEVYGAGNSPYIWVRTPEGMDSWSFMNQLLHNYNISCTPGVGFGPAGEGYVRLTGFNTAEATQEAMERIRRG